MISYVYFCFSFVLVYYLLIFVPIPHFLVRFWYLLVKFLWFCSFSRLTLMCLTLCFFMNILESAFQYSQITCWGFAWSALNLKINLGEMDMFTILNFPIHHHGISFCLFSFFHNFFLYWLFSVYASYTCFRFIPRYLFLLHFIIYLLFCLLLACSHIIDFCVLTVKFIWIQIACLYMLIVCV